MVEAPWRRKRCRGRLRGRGAVRVSVLAPESVAGFMLRGSFQRAVSERGTAMVSVQAAGIGIGVIERGTLLREASRARHRQ